MGEYYAVTRSPEYLEQHGILGMKWGIRRFQNPDGSLTEEGRRRYGDILTKDQMNNYIRSYNLRTGKKKTINKNTIFKTPNGTYDYKGHRINTDTDVDNPGEEKEKKTTAKKVSDMTDAELKAVNERMQDEITFKKRYAELNPVQKTLAQKFIDNTTNALVDEIPKAIGKGIGDYISKAISGGNNNNGNNNNGGNNNNNNNNGGKKNSNTANNTPSQPAGNKTNNSSNTSNTKPNDKKEITNLFGDKDEKLGYKVGRAVDKLSSGLDDVQADFTKALEKGASHTATQRRTFADNAVTKLEKSIKGPLNPSGRAAVNRALSGVLRNASGSEYNRQSTYGTIVKDAYYNQVALEFMSDFGLKPLDQIRNY